MASGYRDLELEGLSSEIHNRSIIFSLAIFSLLAFFASCFIYTLYLCTHRWQNAFMDERQPIGHTATRQTPTVLTSLFRREIGPFFGPEPGLGLDPVIIDSLPTISYGSASISKGVDCSICLSNFECGEKVKLLPECCHAFHSECLYKWLVAHSNCPLCRTRVHSTDPARYIP